SRRRHTRFKCDWSSDVCSSDLVSRGALCQRVVADGPALRGRALPRTRRRHPDGAELCVRAGVSAARDPLQMEHAALRLHRRGAESEEHTSELQSHLNLVCRLLLEKIKQAVLLVIRATTPL